MAADIRRILFTSDLSDTSKHAFSYALRFAERFKAQVVFLFVTNKIPFSGEDYFSQEIIELIERRKASDARSSLIGKRRDLSIIQSGLKDFCSLKSDELANAGETVVSNEVLVAEGDVVDTIVKTAEAQNCDAIILGSRRRGILTEGRLGNVLRGVLKRSDLLVIVAPPLPARKS